MAAGFRFTRVAPIDGKPCIVQARPKRGEANKNAVECFTKRQNAITAERK